uniref:Uncharacterized protein n=1 Tax=Fibrocapsa japonica TaxID=94617 RepID=A0A7S2UXK5_9STRA
MESPEQTSIIDDVKNIDVRSLTADEFKKIAKDGLSSLEKEALIKQFEDAGLDLNMLIAIVDWAVNLDAESKEILLAIKNMVPKSGFSSLKNEAHLDELMQMVNQVTDLVAESKELLFSTNKTADEDMESSEQTSTIGVDTNIDIERTTADEITKMIAKIGSSPLEKEAVFKQFKDGELDLDRLAKIVNRIEELDEKKKALLLTLTELRQE